MHLNFFHSLYTKKWPYLIMALCSLLPFLPYLDSLGYQFIGAGDFISPINIINIIYQRFFVYNPLVEHGLVIDYQIPSFFPGNLLYLILNQVGFSSLIVTLLYLGLILFLTQVCFYQFLKYLFQIKLHFKDDYRWIALSGAIIFAFSPYVISLIPPGHFIQLISYAFIPYLFRLFDEDINRKKFSIKNLPIYFFIFLFSSSAFANVGIIYVVLLTLAFYAFFSVIISKTSLIIAGLSLCLVTLSIFFSNIFWLPMVMDSFSSLAKPDLGINSLTSENNLNIAVQSASIPNLFLGRGENQLFLLKNQAYVNIIPMLIYLYFFCFFIYSSIMLRKQRFVILLFILTIVALFITKGSHSPFPKPFLWFYRNIIGFQIFRRPVSKYAFIFLLLYLSLSYLGIAVASQKLKFEKFLLIIKLPLILASMYFIFAFCSTKEMIPFNIPTGYQNALIDLKAAKVNKILMLPGLSTIQPIYNQTINHLYATDFLQFYWPYPLLRSDIAKMNISTLPQKLNAQLIQRIRNKQSICDITKTLGISHFMLRQNMADYSWFEDKPQEMFSLLTKNPDITFYKTYTEKNQLLFSIFHLKSNCTEQLIHINGNSSSIEYRQINPVTYLIKLTNLRSSVIIEQLLYFDPKWQVKSAVNKKLINEVNKTHRDNGNGFNSWEIDPKKIINHQPNSIYSINPDQSINIDLLLFFSYQDKLYLGVVIFIISTILIILFIEYQHRKKYIV